MPSSISSFTHVSAWYITCGPLRFFLMTNCYTAYPLSLNTEFLWLLDEIDQSFISVVVGHILVLLANYRERAHLFRQL
jgi:hypothetical protein